MRVIRKEASSCSVLRQLEQYIDSGSVSPGRGRAGPEAGVKARRSPWKRGRGIGLFEMTAAFHCPRRRPRKVRWRDRAQRIKPPAWFLSHCSTLPSFYGSFRQRRFSIPPYLIGNIQLFMFIPHPSPAKPPLFAIRSDDPGKGLLRPLVRLRMRTSFPSAHSPFTRFPKRRKGRRQVPRALCPTHLSRSKCSSPVPPNAPISRQRSYTLSQGSLAPYLLLRHAVVVAIFYVSLGNLCLAAGLCGTSGRNGGLHPDPPTLVRRKPRPGNQGGGRPPLPVRTYGVDNEATFTTLSLISLGGGSPHLSCSTAFCPVLMTRYGSTRHPCQGTKQGIASGIGADSASAASCRTGVIQYAVPRVPPLLRSFPILIVKHHEQQDVESCAYIKDGAGTQWRTQKAEPPGLERHRIWEGFVRNEVFQPINKCGEIGISSRGAMGRIFLRLKLHQEHILEEAGGRLVRMPSTTFLFLFSGRPTKIAPPASLWRITPHVGILVQI
eukprot:Gb_09293 [translate_table: standard]